MDLIRDPHKTAIEQKSVGKAGRQEKI